MPFYRIVTSVLTSPPRKRETIGLWGNTRERFSDMVMSFIRGEVWRSVGSSIIAVA